MKDNYNYFLEKLKEKQFYHYDSIKEWDIYKTQHSKNNFDRLIPMYLTNNDNFNGCVDWHLNKTIHLGSTLYVLKYNAYNHKLKNIDKNKSQLDNLFVFGLTSINLK